VTMGTVATTADGRSALAGASSFRFPEPGVHRFDSRARVVALSAHTSAFSTASVSAGVSEDPLGVRWGADA